MNDLNLFSEPDRGDGRRPSDPHARRPARKGRKKRRKGSAAFLFALAFIVAVFGTAGVLGAAWLDNRIHPPDYKGAGAGSVSVQIKEGATGSSIAATLQEHDVVKSVRAFLKVYSKDAKAAGIQPGFYQMRLRMSSASAMALLHDPKSRAGSQITIPEGRRAAEVFATLAKKTGIPVRDFQAAARDTRGIGLPSYARGQGDRKVEGYLFPGRYDLDPNATAKQILKQMVDRFKDEARTVGLEDKAGDVGLDPGEVVVLASLLQAEGGTEEDYPKIARVLYNRLKIKMKLRLDTTVLYAQNRRSLNVTTRDTAVSSPYSTYQVPGLPAGAIDSPGAKALEAALAPARGNWIFFVTTDPSTGFTEYGTTDADFTRMQKKLNDWLAAHPQRR
ncbi:endolytic transglycosylase MltG [Actinomadura parmotrematis]|uniref:Endolytic murein transglycosylase n=1 Tax=Actinomadura parmotrematis TaxID=2864039 RepID=A0ABS7G1I6_9ACTN|nr:endolytic transglycosylase MltG [Actinomadura parmotrematis]MBW8486553.1 endolytic transglycosylase MltG [Actinomadura parmotrematis]